MECGSQRWSRWQRGHYLLFTDDPWIEGGQQGEYCSHPGLDLESAKLVIRAHLEGRALEKGRPEMVGCLEFCSDLRTLGKHMLSQTRLLPGQHQPL